MRIRQRKRINSIGMVTATIRAALVMVVALTMVSIMGFTAFMFWTVYPPNERSENADVVVVIAGASDGRHELGAEIALKYGIKNFVVSNPAGAKEDRKSTRLNSSHVSISYAVFCL